MGSTARIQARLFFGMKKSKRRELDVVKLAGGACREKPGPRSARSTAIRVHGPLGLVGRSEPGSGFPGRVAILPLIAVVERAGG